jgi:Bcr/CflA subfamily drug resistance transporter
MKNISGGARNQMNKPYQNYVLLYLPFILPIALAFDLYLPCIPGIANALSITQNQVQYTLSACMVSFGIGQLIIGPLSDKIGRRKVILLSAIIFTVGSYLCSISNTFITFILGRICQAFGACGTQVVAIAIVRDLFKGKDSAIIFSYLKAGAALSPLIAPTVGAFFLIQYGWSAIFQFLTLYGIFIFLLSYYKINETIKEEKTKLNIVQYYLQSYKYIISNANFIYFALCALLGETINFLHYSLSSRYYITQHNLSESQFALLFGCDSLIYLLSGIFLSKKIFPFGLKKCTAYAAILLLFSGVCMLIADLFFNHFTVLFFPQCIASIGTMTIVSASLTGAMAPFKKHAGTAAAILGCIEFLGSGLIGMLILNDNSASVHPLAFSLIVFGILITSIYLFQKNRVKFNIAKILIK